MRGKWSRQIKIAETRDPMQIESSVMQWYAHHVPTCRQCTDATKSKNRLQNIYLRCKSKRLCATGHLQAIHLMDHVVHDIDGYTVNARISNEYPSVCRFFEAINHRRLVPPKHSGGLTYIELKEKNKM